MLGDGGMAPGQIRAPMGGDPFTAVEELDGVGADAGVELEFHQLIRNAVVVAFDLDVVVDVDAHFLPGGEDVRAGRQGTERRLFEFLEQCASGPREFLKRPLVERYQQLGDGAVKVIEVEEGLMSKAGENPAFDDLHGDLHFGFVARFCHSSR